MLKTILTTSALLLAATATHAAIVSDDFDSYADQAAFQAAWPVVPSGSTAVQLSNVQSVSPSQSILSPGSTSVAYRVQKTGFTTGAVSPTNAVTFSFDFYDSASGNAAYRNWCTVQTTSAPSLTNQLVSIGMNNNQSNSASGGNFYEARILGYTPSATDPDGGAGETGTLTSGQYFKLNDYSNSPLRSTGWHNFKVIISSDDGIGTDYAFYVDNILAETVSNVGTVPRAYDTIQLGSGNTNAGNASYYDNVFLDAGPIPEPSLATAALAALPLLRRTRRR